MVQPMNDELTELIHAEVLSDKPLKLTKLNAEAVGRIAMRLVMEEFGEFAFHSVVDAAWNAGFRAGKKARAIESPDDPRATEDGK